jgi:cytochrome c biogenesis protein CcmG/thiol:disulfide interchange protein DsbE
MSQVAEPSTEAIPVATARPTGLPRHIKWLVGIAVVVTALVIYSVVQTLHTTASSGTLGNVQSVGFFKPQSTNPVVFSLPLLTPKSGQGNVTMASELGKPVVINFWSTTCTVCVEETPAIESVARKIGSQVQFVGIDTLDQRGPARAFVKRYGVTYQELFDAEGKVADGYAAPGLPVSIFVTSSGKVVGENLGALSTTSLSHYLKLLFGTSVPG